MQPLDPQRAGLPAGEDAQKVGPGDWCEQLIDGAKPVAVSGKHTFLNYGEETTNKVLEKAQERVSSYSVIIATIGTVRNSEQSRHMNPGSGVLVRRGRDMYGVLTAGHVLKRPGNTVDEAGVTVVASPRGWNHGDAVLVMDLESRPCTVVGYHNESEEGPDLAIIPLASGEWRKLEGRGMVAYNLDKKRWSDEDKAKLRKMNPWCISIINGIRWEASQIVKAHADRKRLLLTMVASTTRVEEVGERRGYDYLELDSETNDYSYPTHWKDGLPGTAAEEIDELYEEGVTKRVWGGISGAGVWNLVIGTNQSGLPDGEMLLELAGTCFYANHEKGCIIAHGAKSIKKITASHREKEAVRFHSKA